MALKKRYISPYTTIAAFAHVKRRKSLLVIRTQTNWFCAFWIWDLENRHQEKFGNAPGNEF